MRHVADFYNGLRGEGPYVSVSDIRTKLELC